MNVEHCIGVIQRKASNEGHAVPQEVVARYAVNQVLQGYHYVMDCGPLVFTVAHNRANPVVHMYGEGDITKMLAAGAEFMRRVWVETGHQFLLAPIKEPTIARCAVRAGWRKVGMKPHGHAVYRIERPKNGRS